MSGQHTPGPWVAAMARSSPGWRDVRVAKTGVAIASVSAARHEVDANANLIAVAPDMYEALLSVMDDLSARYDGAEDSKTAWMSSHIEAIEALLARAQSKP